MADAVDVDATVAVGYGRRVEDGDRADVHVGIVVLEVEEARVQGGQSLVV
jgi:hypothetical protein